MAIIIGIKYNHIERGGALTFRVYFVNIRGKRKGALQFAALLLIVIVLLTCSLYFAKLTALVSLMTVILI